MRTGTFDYLLLRRRVAIHERYAAGASVEDIAEKFGISTKNVRYHLSRVKPKLRPLASDRSWRQDAACSHLDTELFFPDLRGKGTVVRKEMAKQICAGCPVAEQCREAALENYETAGIWAGEDFSRHHYFYDDATGEVFVRVGDRNGALKKVS